MNNLKRDNYIAFDGRKFAPVQLSTTRLEKIIPKDTISQIVAKCDDMSPTYDAAYVRQIAEWIIKNCDYSHLFPQGEHKGDKYWELAHSSMTLWQRFSVATLLDPSPAFSWAGAYAAAARRPSGINFKDVYPTMRKQYKRIHAGERIPTDISAYREFLLIYRDLKGRPVFEVSDFDEMNQDFNVKILAGALEEDIL